MLLTRRSCGGRPRQRVPGPRTENVAGSPASGCLERREEDDAAALVAAAGSETRSYLVDPASSHMLVSKIKPCMSKYILLHGETANGSLNQLWFLRSYDPTWITVVILELIHATEAPT